VTEPTRQTPAPPTAIVRLVRAALLDAELAALLSMTVEGGIPLVVAGPSMADGQQVRDAMLSLLPESVPLVRLAGDDETFAWMPEAGELGWHSTGPAAPGSPGAAMVVRLDDAPGATWGEAARLAIRALTVGYSLLAATGGTRLEDVLGRLSAGAVGATDDELSRLGVVLVLGEGRPGHPVRVEAAHYVRPVARDPGGHVQRLPPAVLAAWSPASGRWDHFAWGVAGELAGRTGRRPLDFEREQARRAAAISAAATRG
jgi:hypothetical protein